MRERKGAKGKKRAAPRGAPPRVVEERRQRLAKILPLLTGLYPQARCSLDHSNPLELLVATILSAQCTDERVNIVTKDLFARYRSAADYAGVPQERLERDIQSTGFFRNKAKSLRGMAEALVQQHRGQVPDSMEALVALPGVGRKTANVVLGNAFGRNEGIVVDTHVTRLANRLRLTSHAADAVKIEQDLVQVVPREFWTLLPHLLIHHGRAICLARRPRCEQCPLLPHCPAGQQFMAEMAQAAKPKGKRPRQPSGPH
jgi:endonuclease-3